MRCEGFLTRPRLLKNEAMVGVSGGSRESVGQYRQGSSESVDNSNVGGGLRFCSARTGLGG